MLRQIHWAGFLTTKYSSRVEQNWVNVVIFHLNQKMHTCISYTGTINATMHRFSSGRNIKIKNDIINMIIIIYMVKYEINSI